MRILHQLPAEGSLATVATVGNFDGVHLGHQQLLRAVAAEARTRKLQSIAVTFDPHPARILRPEAAPRLLTPGPRKAELIADCGLDLLLELPFHRDLSLLSPREFVERILVAGVGAQAVHEGENFRFGQRQQGTVTTLRELGDELGFTVAIHAAVIVGGAVVSSSRVREVVAAGEVTEAVALLGRPFAVRGLIAPGRGIGRQRTVPTLNLQHYDELLPGKGVYITQVAVAGGELQPALTNVGVRPTFGEGGPLSVESHLLRPPAEGIPAHLGDSLEIVFLKRLRDEQRF
ncbi:MAG TPA: riboflavin biosynthesis protein RibF, partial [Terriglobales bacterium]|nr:riboflavin biosynthesis protein RibF [Terriglobales bacterium]